MKPNAWITLSTPLTSSKRFQSPESMPVENRGYGVGQQMARLLMTERAMESVTSLGGDYKGLL